MVFIHLWSLNSYLFLFSLSPQLSQVVFDFLEVVLHFLHFFLLGLEKVLEPPVVLVGRADCLREVLLLGVELGGEVLREFLQLELVALLHAFDPVHQLLKLEGVEFAAARAELLEFVLVDLLLEFVLVDDGLLELQRQLLVEGLQLLHARVHSLRVQGAVLVPVRVGSWVGVVRIAWVLALALEVLVLERIGQLAHKAGFGREVGLVVARQEVVVSLLVYLLDFGAFVGARLVLLH